MPVFFESGLLILIPVAFGIARKTKEICILLFNPAACRTGNRTCIYPTDTGTGACGRDAGTYSSVM